jgi:SAM-dependent methyltransferase
MRSSRPLQPEISDLIVDYEPATLARRDVHRDTVLAALDGSRRARSIAAAIPHTSGILDRTAVDGILVRSHLELQRLHEEFRVGEMIRGLLVPLLQLVRDATTERPVRVVDLGCGMGFVVRWLAARGNLGEDVELVGADYNLALVRAAQRLADDERLPCRFVAANAFRLEQPAHVVMSTGVLHHFRGDALSAVFAEHARSGALAFLHADIRPSAVAPLGAWIFHQARMREPLARFDGYWSAVRAHPADALRAAVPPAFQLAMIDARPGLAGLLRIFQVAIGARTGDLRTAYAHYGSRLS